MKKTYILLTIVGLFLTNMTYAEVIPTAPNDKYGTGHASALSDSNLTQDPTNMHVYISGDAAKVIYNALNSEPSFQKVRDNAGEVTSYTKSNDTTSCVQSTEEGQTSTKCTLRVKK